MKIEKLGNVSGEIEHLNLAICPFLMEHKFFVVYLITINLITFISFAVDKKAAIRHRSRVRVATLLELCFIGGSLGGLAAMYCFRHKTRKRCFTIGVPLMICVQMAAMVIAMNAGL